MTDAEKKVADKDENGGQPQAESQPGDVNEGHSTEALEEASERMLLRKDRA